MGILARAKKSQPVGHPAFVSQQIRFRLGRQLCGCWRPPVLSKSWRSSIAYQNASA